ncbi:hypothetical protein V6C32_01295 [Desulforamulus ruminis]|uniref:Uncharacterized protein n=1 Tax=Desulforamulus ruminis (strain ATCC 23193 / DSM 2154 / NCIMB 8452 / DL) TaxID=696281 RepID=F6DMF3_DESRL|nr:hypothetical protein [Desulforamulus ruminis]AEG61714.1 hypothetical protein Desru_3511 [Desulforamulus ruminis DSM 2154]
MAGEKYGQIYAGNGYPVATPWWTTNSPGSETQLAIGRDFIYSQYGAFKHAAGAFINFKYHPGLKVEIEEGGLIRISRPKQI